MFTHKLMMEARRKIMSRLMIGSFQMNFFRSHSFLFFVGWFGVSLCFKLSEQPMDFVDKNACLFLVDPKQTLLP